MSNTHLNIQIALDPTQTPAATLKASLEATGEPFLEILDLINDIAVSGTQGKLLFHIDAGDGTAASQTIAWDGSDGVAGDTVTVAGIVLTAVSTYAYPGSDQFTLSSNDTTMAQNFDTCINSHPILRHLVTATNVTSTTTLTAVEGGTFGNLITLATSNTDLATLGGAVFASGAAGTKTKDVTVDMECTNIV